MPLDTMQAAKLAPSRGGLRLAAPFLMLGLLALGAMFQAEIAAALSVWETSTAYGHCVFVLPIALYLAWDRRASIRATHVAPLPLAAVLAAPPVLVWLAAERLGLMEGRQLAVIALVQVLFLAVLGWRMWRALAVPLLYLFFLVPFGAFVTPALQAFTARFIVAGLTLLGIPHFADNYIIEIPEGIFYVAEACAGLRFLIAAIAFGVLYACLIYRSPMRRAVFMLASIAIPVVANGFRGLGIVVLGHIIGSAEAAAADHIIYGWVFFSVVILLLIVAGLPFREDGVEYKPIGATGRTLSAVTVGRLGRAAIAALAVSVAAPASAMLIERGATTPVAAIDPAFLAPANCGTLPSAPAGSGDAPRTHRFACEPLPLTTAVATASPRVNPAAVLGLIRRMTGQSMAEDTDIGVLHVPGMEPETWQLTETTTPAGLTATSLWVDGAPAPGGIGFRIRQAWRGIVGGSHAVVVVAVSVDPKVAHLSEPERRILQRELGEFLRGQTALAGQIASLSAVPSQAR